MRKIGYVVIHCSATPNGRHVTVEEIDKWHAARGFMRTPSARSVHNPHLEAIGYHSVIYVDGIVKKGRSVEETGAHARGLNTASLGVCLVGTDSYTMSQWTALYRLVKYWAREYGPLQIIGHRETPYERARLAAERKVCPGFSVERWLRGGMEPMPALVLGG